MRVASLRDAQKLLASARVLAMGNTAFARVGLHSLVDDLEIICIRETADLESMRSKMKVKSLERDFGNPGVEKYNTSELLSKDKVRDYLKSIEGKKHLFVYKSSPGIERAAEELSLGVLSSPSKVRRQFEDKWEFRALGREAGVNLPKGEQMMLEELNGDKLNKLQDTLGEKLVFQLPEYMIGGGIGTFFVSSRKEFDEFWGYVKRRREAGKELTRVNVTEYVGGESASMVACVTRHGVLTGKLQRQLVDLREVVGFYGRSGVFAGHEWGEFYCERLEAKARAETVKLGEFMYKKGYRGIFGVDLAVNPERTEVVLVECNSRYTGAFPMYSMLQNSASEIPLDAWHLLEFLDADYEMDFDGVQKSYGKQKIGAQLILHNLTRAFVRVGGEVRAGVYSFAGGSLEYRRPGFELADLESDDEAILTDGVPFKGGIYKPGYRIGRLLFRRGVTEDGGKVLQEKIKASIEKLYQLYSLERVDKDSIGV